MSEVKYTPCKDLVKLKLAVLDHATKFVPEGQVDYTIKNAARDDCYVSWNSLQYKRKQVEDQKDAIKLLMPVAPEDFESASEEDTTQRVSIQLSRKAEILKNMLMELEYMQIRYASACAAHLEVTGEQYNPAPASTGSSKGLADMSEIAKLLA